MKTPFALLVGLSLGAALSFTQCSPVSTCSPANCLGCCDGNGRCAAGTTNTGCGKDGVVCVACAMGQTCMSNVCSVIINNTGGGTSGTGGGTSGTGGGTSGTGGGTSGTGGGTSGTGGGTSGTGGGASGGTSGTGGGGSSGGCRVYQALDSTSARGRYEATSSGAQMGWGAGDVLGTAGSGNIFTLLEVQLYHTPGQPPSFPLSGQITPGPFKTCDQCFRISIACDSMGLNCAGDYIARSGQYTFQSGTTNQSAGTFTGEATNLRFLAWNLVTDQPVSGQPCLDVSRLTWRAAWP